MATVVNDPNLYEMLADLRQSHGRVEEAIMGLRRDFESRRQRTSTLEDRVTSIEHKQSFAAGRNLVFGLFGGGLAAKLIHWVWPGQ